MEVINVIEEEVVVNRTINNKRHRVDVVTEVSSST